MTRLHSPLMFTTLLLYSLSLLAGVVCKDLGTPGYRPSLSNPIHIRKVTNTGPSCPIPVIVITPVTPVNETLHKRTFLPTDLAARDVTPEVKGASCPRSAIKISVVNGTPHKRALPFNDLAGRNVTPGIAGPSCASPGIQLPSSANGTHAKRTIAIADLIAKGQYNVVLQAASEEQLQTCQSMWKFDDLAKHGWIVANRPSDALDMLEDLPMSAVTKPWPQGIGMVSTAPPLIGSSFIHGKESQGLPKKYNVSASQ